MPPAVAFEMLSTGEFVPLDEALRRFREVTVADVRDLAADIALRAMNIVAVGDLTEDTFAGLV